MNLNAFALDERLRRDPTRQVGDVADDGALRAHLDAERTDACIHRCAGGNRGKNVDDIDLNGVLRPRRVL